ncbi:LysR family transcriptional regulator [Cupriavidus sp. TA19]|uniref:LysR family transcriptional regulator n=1 Tax=unclassified Cupriavidus TaxID=2640874 RepID=UPI000E2FB1B0|nr:MULTISPECIES: LysR substrate-binding domain-containing protein [unclassified Cupriavidus]BDB26349.1 LysR family transcriptional regulator [Cupriavidus sp. P-10]GLC92722.1 LysR family transcriptional regulator [Cupriavidus sp. TA19]
MSLAAPDKLVHNLVSRLRLRHLPLLLALERQRSVSRVAAELNLSQPAVTKTLREIEDIFMVPLFTRTRRGLEPTPTGRAVLAHARLTLADTDALGRELAAIGAGMSGRLRIGVIPFISRTVLDAACSFGLTQSPRVSVLVREGTTDELVAALREHELDCVVARTFYAPGADIAQQPLYREEPALVVPAGAASRLGRGPLDWRRLAERDWILPPPNTPIRRTINTIFAVAGVAQPVPIVETYSIKTMATLLRNHAAATTIVPRAVAGELVEGGGAAVLPHALSWDLPPVGVMWRRQALEDDVVVSLVATLGSLKWAEG